MGTTVGGNYGKSESGASGNQYGFNLDNMLQSNADISFGLTEGGSYGEQSGGGSSSSQSTSSTSQDVWSGQSPFLKAVYEAAQGGYGGAQQGIAALQPGVQGQVNNAAALGNLGFQNQLFGGAARGLGPSQAGAMLGNSEQQAMLNNYGSNPYVDAMKGQIAADAQKLKQQNLGSLDARAAAAGMSGSSGYRNQVSDMMENVDEATLNQMTNLGYNSFTQAMNDRMRLAGAADQFNMQAAGAGDQYALSRANALDSNINNAYGQTQLMQQAAMNQFQPAMAQLNAAGQFGQIIGGPTTLTQGESQSTSSSSNSYGGFNSSFNNGINIGLGLGSQMGWGTGTSTGADTSSSESTEYGANIGG